MQQTINLSRKQIAQISLSQKCKSVIFGSILGDGSLKKTAGYANARFSLRHSVMQSDYFYWKINMLKEISAQKSVFLQKADGFSKNKKLRYQSSAKPQLTELWQKVGKNQMIIRRSWLNHMSALSLAIWWFDDGSIITNGRQGVICTDNFHKDYCNILAKYLKVTWDINCRVGLKSQKLTRQNLDYRLWLNNKELRKFLNIVLPYAETKFTIKKCLLIYKETDFQQRWISNMKKLLPRDSMVILREVVAQHEKINPLVQ